MGRPLATTLSPARIAVWTLVVALAGGAPAPSAVADVVRFPIELQGDRTGQETRVRAFAAALPDRPLREDMQGYTPTVEGVPVLWEGPAELVWDFGDGSPTVSTGERASASHVYQRDGSYTVTVTARDRRGAWATGSLAIEVNNRPPHSAHLAAIEIEPESTTVELTATAQDAETDPLTFAWDFGDGQSARGGAADLWRVRHRYPAPGTYEATLTITDGDGGERVETAKVRVLGAAAAGVERTAIDGEPTTEAVVTGLTAAIRGAFAADLDADVRSLRGLYLQRVESGACRLMFTAWDDANLTSLHAVVDLFGVPPEGARYRVERPQVALVFSPDARHYAYNRQASFGRLAGGLEALIDEAARHAPVPGQEPPRPGATEPPQADPEPTLPATSPIGVEERTSFITDSGSLELEIVPGERAIGHFDLVLAAKHGKARGQTVRFAASLALDLAAARADGIVNDEGCEPPPFEIESTWPEDGSEHLTLERPRIQVRFSTAVDPATLDQQTFQVAYPRIGGELVPVAGKILRDRERVSFVPDEPLLRGVRHTIRVRAGALGVRSRAGAPLADPDASGWRSSEFTTGVDMIPETDGDQLLACHLFQTVRDAPLVPGKPAVARIYAAWQRQLGIADHAQVDEIDARVVIKDALHNELASAWHTFVRPDLWVERRIDQRAAEHTAQVAGLLPQRGMAGPLRVELEVRDRPGSDALRTAYAGRCPTTIWDRSPRLSLDFVALPFGDWTDPVELAAIQPTLTRIASQASTLAWQLFPVVEVTPGPVRTLSFPADLRLPPIAECSAGCLMNGAGAGHWWQGFDAWLRAQSADDIVVAFVPDGLQQGGSAGGRLINGRGAALFLVSAEPQHISRFVQGVVHEVAHTLGLEHLPFVADGPDAQRRRDALTALREGTQPILYRGIEGLSMSRDGRSVRNKSAIEGNEEDATLAPLMFPAGFAVERSFIANHHYRALQRLFETLGR